MSSPTRKRIIGLSGSSLAWKIAQLYAQQGGKRLVICPTRKIADELFEDLQFFLDKNSLVLLPGWESLPLEEVSPALEISAQRISVLTTLFEDDAFLIVTSADTLIQKIPEKKSFEALTFVLSRGLKISRDQLAAKLFSAGFKITQNVEQIGEASIKGLVVDLYPSTTQTPIRIELLDNTISRIESFDPNTQRTITSDSSSQTYQEITSVKVLPVRELTVLNSASKEDFQTFEDRIRERATQTSTPPREIEKAVQSIIQNLDYPGIELLQYIIATELTPLCDLIPKDTSVTLVNHFEIERALNDFITLAEERSARLEHDQHLVPKVSDLYCAAEHALTSFNTHAGEDLSHLELLNHERSSVLNLKADTNIELSTRMRSSVGTGDAFRPLAAFLDQWRVKKFCIAFVVGSAHRAERLKTILLNVGTDAPVVSTSGLAWFDAPQRPPVVVMVGHLEAGFRLPKEKVIYVSENEVFGERSYRTGKAPRMSAKRLLNSLSLLKENDFVVHIDYGVGVYQGLRHLTVDGVLGDFLQVDYADSKLYLPAHQIGKIQKFVATEGQQPSVDKLGSTRWARTKQKIRDSVITLAGDLIRLYASRSVSKGWRFEPHGAEDERFADTFQFDETPDQRKAIQDTIADLATDKPMDRLVCGDVGFGKTEVAIRAAFKATQHARQVALLVPTTILVEQHAKNFIDRFSNYPVKIAAVSRFYTAEQNLKTMQEVASGKIDIVIGTHRLLQPDVQFKDLGLLIIDEEHRFGVKQKERLRSYRMNIDVLTLTATPIPRTLHMSLLGIRDISLISTAPVDRKIVNTSLAEHDDALIRDAILREHRRGGQSFYIHNRVQSISNVAAKLAEIVPEVRFDFAHGQMSETELERIMKRFVQGEFDVLITTTIIESGLDVPNANTMIIDRADQFGLAQLYQLRGRVGRSKRQAYAYFLVPQVKSLSTEAQERLKVLQSLDSLGIGFNLALRDLEIRGAGNLLGKEQSGSVLSVGFDMYCRILNEAVADLRGEEAQLEDVVDPDIRIVGVDAFIPEIYVPDIGERLVLYQRLSNIRSDEEAWDMYREIEDRFGPMTLEVENLMTQMRFRGVLRRNGVVKSEVTPLKASLTFSPMALLRDGLKANSNTRIDGMKALRLVQEQPHKYKFGKSNTLTILLDPKEVTDLSMAVQTIEKTLVSVQYSG